MSSSTHRRGTHPPGGTHPPAHPALRWSNWNLLLLVPLITLITPLYNAREPRLFGFPYFYWLQFLFIPLGVVCVAVVYGMTRAVGGPVNQDRLDRERDRDQGAGR